MTTERTVLPPPDPEFHGVIGDTMTASTPDWPAPARPPAGAPNVVVILLDDLGFGQLSCFGGPIEAPTIARLAANGLRYRNFHTTSLCSPSRAALLTGRNHHSVGFSVIAELASGFPAHNALLPRRARTVAEVMRQHGYATYCTGKWHLTPSAESTAAGPFDRWPLGQGFERYYGFLPGETDQWHPMLTVDNHRIPVPERDGYHLSEDLVDQAVTMLADQTASGRPFLLYLPFGAVHCPFHVPKRYIERYRGRFDAGWDEIRHETFARQQALGIVPADNELPPRNPGVVPWDELDEDARTVYCRLMETFAGMVDHTDEQIGRLVDALTELGVLEDTLLMVMSDNGASQEGRTHGTLNTERFRNGEEMSVAEMLPRLDDIGGPDTDPHYPAGWAMAGNTPFRRCKRDTHRGGNTDPLVVHWPARIPDPGTLRDQYLHIVDVYPTLLDVAGLPVPTHVDGIEQQRLDGRSFAATFADRAAPEIRTTQHYEMVGSRAIYEDGWMAVTWHRPGTSWDDDHWELYDQRVDYTQAHDLATAEPERLARLIDRWWEEAREHGALPLDDRSPFERFLAPGRPTASEPRAMYRYRPGTAPIPAQALPDVFGGSFALTAHLTLERADDEGYVAGCGGELSGWALYVRDRRVTFVDNRLQVTTSAVTTRGALPVGEEVAVTLQWDAVDFGSGEATLLLGGEVVVRSGLIPHGRSSPVQEGFQVGRSWAPSVARDHFVAPFPFTGTLRVVEVRAADPLAAS